MISTAHLSQLMKTLTLEINECEHWDYATKYGETRLKGIQTRILISFKGHLLLAFVQDVLGCPQNVSVKIQLKILHRSFIITGLPTSEKENTGQLRICCILVYMKMCIFQLKTTYRFNMGCFYWSFCVPRIRPKVKNELVTWM